MKDFDVRKMPYNLGLIV